MQDNEGFKMLRDAFANFASNYQDKDLTGRITRSVAAGAKAAVDHGMTEFPKDFISDMAKDVYTLITSQEIADGVSSAVRSFDEAAVTDMLNNFVASMQDPQKSVEIAKKLKELLQKVPAADLGAQFDAMLEMSNMPFEQRMIAQMFFQQIQPILDSMKNGSDEDVAAQLGELANQIPVDLIAQQVGQLTGEVTPERVSKQAHDLVSGMPSPTAISEIVHGVAGSASEHLGRVAQGEDAQMTMMSFMENARDVVAAALNGDVEAKKTFPKKGRKFE